MTRSPRLALAATALCAVLVVAACANTPDDASAPGGRIDVTGVIASIDTQPWMYDGNAVVEVDVEAPRRRMAVQLPARWNLCVAEPVDVEALSVGQRVRVVGNAGNRREIVVCQDASHRLVPAG
ncbi:hypothetical protein E2F46_14820 [Luteimonas aestuarii]|uniref:DUF5666 domain-containing protein n=1 Tax=Luteimonas aestuarii TaxID=453837 RepID=A0A4R5TSX3_9GAMM|nr:hypothetical protein [Luteimonas aestuarii]TDK21505.1 hypothetical protein E2F46_14820 [Luteimonas aestuarii]